MYATNLKKQPQRALAVKNNTLFNLETVAQGLLMTTDLLVRYFHFMGIFAMFALLTTQHSMLKGTVAITQFKKLTTLDAIYGISALITLLCGAGLWFWVGKPAGFYSHNWVFHTKVALFVLTGLLSFIPTSFLIKNRKSPKDSIDIPKYIIMIIRLEMLLICTIPLLAVLMANGVGYTR